MAALKAVTNIVNQILPKIHPISTLQRLTGHKAPVQEDGEVRLVASEGNLAASEGNLAASEGNPAASEGSEAEAVTSRPKDILTTEEAVDRTNTIKTRLEVTFTRL